MERIVSGYTYSIAKALGVLPSGMRARVQGVHFWTGTDPRWAGVVPRWESKHRYLSGPTAIACAYPNHTLDKRVSVVMLVPESRGLRVVDVVHELGHVLAWNVGVRDHDATPVTTYAMNSRHEAFAEALVTWLFKGYGDEESLFTDLPTLDLFRRLSARPD